jgi:hypothetical protein
MDVVFRQASHQQTPVPAPRMGKPPTPPSDGLQQPKLDARRRKPCLSDVMGLGIGSCVFLSRPAGRRLTLSDLPFSDSPRDRRSPSGRSAEAQASLRRN